jgi:hypothetical protein
MAVSLVVVMNGPPFCRKKRGSRQLSTPARRQPRCAGVLIVSVDQQLIAL